MGIETMTLKPLENGHGEVVQDTHLPHSKQKQRRKFRAAILAAVLLLIILVLVVVILAVTVFRIKEPKIQLVSASLQGVAPRLSFPAVNIELNITLNLTLLIQNRNHASFKGGQGQSVLLYQGDQVGDAGFDPGLIPARGTSNLSSLLTLQVDRFAQPGLTSLINDIMGGQLVMETKTRIPGRAYFLGIFKKHIVATSDCRFAIGFPDLKIKNQDCESHTKL